MREFEVRSQISSRDLTPNSNPSTLKLRGNIFMSGEPGRGEGTSTKSSTVQEARPIETPKWATPDLENIKNPVLKKLAADLRDKLEVNPLDKWSDTDLEDSYVQLHAERQRLASEAQEVSEREGIAAEAQQVGWGILAELQDRGVDVGKLILKATNTDSEPEGLSMGPGTMAAPPEEAGRRPREGRVDPLEVELERIRNIADPKKREEELLELLADISPHTNRLPDSLIKEVIESDKALDYVVNRIIAAPLDAETSDYRLSFDGGINLEAIKDIIKAESGRKPDMAKRYQRILLVTEAVSLFHTMNSLIVSGNLEGFVRGSQGITPRQFQALQDVRGVSKVMRIFNGEFQRVLARDKYINSDNYEELMGSRGAEKEGDQRMGTVEQKFRDLIKSGVEGDMEEWELRWAFNAGKLLSNLSLRSAELISLGEVPEGGSDERYASIPQESAAKLMNWLGWTGFRFDISQERGGVELSEMAQHYFQSERTAHGYSDISIKTIGGKKIEDFELASMFGVSGIWSGWRQNLIILKNLNIKIGEYNGNLRDYYERVKKDPDKLRDAFLVKDADGKYTLREEFTSALGVLLKAGVLTPSEKDLKTNKKMIGVREQIRTAIWKRAARDNPLAVATLLHGLKVGEQKTIYLTDDGTENGSTTVWDGLTTNLNILHEIRMSRIEKGEVVSLDQIISEQSALEEGIKLTPDQVAMLAKIRGEGDRFAGEFANVRFAFNPFMNDVLFEKINYMEAGDQFYGRRAGSDLPSFHTSYGEFVKLMDNPGGHSVDDALKVLLGVVQAVGQPNGIGFGQDRIVPFLKAYFDFIEKGGQIKKGVLTGVLKWASKNNVYSWIQGIRRKGNSLAQEFSGYQAPSVDEFDLGKIIDKALHMGLTRKKRFDKEGKLMWTDTEEQFRKKYKVKLGWLILAFFRDLVPAVVLNAIVDLGQKTGKEKGA